MLGGIWGCILSELKEYTPRPPKKNSGRDFDFPPRPSLKRPKGAKAPFGNPCSETDGGVFLRWDRGRRMRAGCLRSCRVFWVAGDEVGEAW